MYTVYSTCVQIGKIGVIFKSVFLFPYVFFRFRFCLEVDVSQDLLLYLQQWIYHTTDVSLHNRRKVSNINSIYSYLSPFKMFRFFIALAVIAVVAAFGPAQQSRSRSNQIVMAAKPSMAKNFGIALIASTFLSLPAFAVEGAAPKQSYFGDSPASSPFTINEDREDPMYSPYSPFGNGEKAVYTITNRKGGPEETKFWSAQLEECA